MEPKIKITADGSHTLLHPVYGDSYHSLNGAETESRHVYIENGLNFCDKDHIRVLEVGFGSGLNALLTMQEAAVKNIKIDYTAIELYPIPLEVAEQLSFANQNDFLSLHRIPWGKTVQVSHLFSLKKLNIDLLCADLEHIFDIVYFDAFAPDTQPELWSEEVFETIFKHMQEGGALVTYSVKGVVKRALRQVGFKIQRLEGAPGKRHMLRAIKPVPSDGSNRK